MNVRKALKFVTGGFIAAAAVLETHSIVYPKVDSLSPDNPYVQQCRLVVGWFKKISESLPNMTTVQAYSSFPRDNIKPWNWNWDNRQPLAGNDQSRVSSWGDRRDSTRGTGSRHLLFIRHGQYHYASSDVDCHLTQLGKEQLNFTGARLKQLNLPYSVLYYSTMTRAIESTEEIIRHLPNLRVEPTESLREGAPFPLEPPLDSYKPTEEELNEDGERIEKAFQMFVHRPSASQTEDSYEIFVCHANVIRYIVCRALQIPPEAWIRFSLDHGSITWVVIRPNGRVALRWLGNSGHMPPEKITVI